MQWPVPGSSSKELPGKSGAGCFWQNRGDRYHCGIDIYAPKGSIVNALEDGVVLDMGLFTSPDHIVYWNPTYFIVVAHVSGIIARYAELDNYVLENDDIVVAGNRLGYVGQVLNSARITDQSPDYVRQLCTERNTSMLHLEMFSRYPADIPNYLGGNTFQNKRPSFLLNPCDYLEW
jgi:murein DD-endopeptidase MepM/ murein hydrolase activator NlpD